jgi:hypothetical protein
VKWCGEAYGKVADNLKLLPDEVYLAALKRPRGWRQMFKRPTKKEALRVLRYWTGQDFGDDVECWQRWIAENVETFYASGSNGATYPILVSIETTPTGEKQEVLRTPSGIKVIRLGDGKYQMLSEFYGDQILTTFDPNKFDNWFEN